MGNDIASQQLQDLASLTKEPVPGVAIQDSQQHMFRDVPMRDQMVNREYEEPKQLFGPFVLAGMLTIFFGHAKVGKSIVMLQIAMGIARGQGIGMKCQIGPSKVLYIDLENKDTTQWKRTKGYDWPNGNLIRCQIDSNYEGDMRKHLPSEILRLMAKHQTNIVILDNLSYFDSEIKKDIHSETQELLKRLDVICQSHNATIILGAHRPKGNKGPMDLESLAGSSELSRRCDCVVGMGKPDDNPDARYLVQVATRDDREEYNSDNVAYGQLEQVDGLLQWVPDPTRNCKEALLFNSDNTVARINKGDETLRLLLEDPEMLQDEIVDAIGMEVSASTVTQSRNAAKAIRYWQTHVGATGVEVKRETGVDDRAIAKARKHLKYD
jgi:archaellum biogenesis ATPase FlaH